MSTLLKIANDAAEKYAARAWKLNMDKVRNSGRLGELIDSNVLNYSREIDGINKGTNNIQQALRSKFKDLTLREVHTPASKTLEGHVAYKHNGTPRSTDTWMMPTTAEIHVPHKFEVINTNPDSVENRYLRAMTLRHETDEVRYGVEEILRESNLSDAHTKSRIIGHNSARIVNNESKLVGVAPDDVRRYMKDFRDAPDQEVDLINDASKFVGKKTPFVYGNNARDYTANAKAYDRVKERYETRLRKAQHDMEWHPANSKIERLQDRIGGVPEDSALRTTLQKRVANLQERMLASPLGTAYRDMLNNPDKYAPARIREQ